MKIWAFFLTLITLSAHGADAYLLRSKAKIKFTKGITVQVNDQVFTNDSAVQFSPRPGVLIKLSKKSVMKILQDSSELSKGSAHIRATNYAVKSNQVAFNSKEFSEFDVRILKDGADLDVTKGEVEVSSPLIQTFVPEIVKTNEGFTFSRKKEKFVRRKFKKKQG